MSSVRPRLILTCCETSAPARIATSPATTTVSSAGSSSAMRCPQSVITVPQSRNVLDSATSPWVGRHDCQSPTPAASPPSCIAIAALASESFSGKPSLMASAFHAPQVCAEL